MPVSANCIWQQAKKHTKAKIHLMLANVINQKRPCAIAYHCVVLLLLRDTLDVPTQKIYLKPYTTPHTNITDAMDRLHDRAVQLDAEQLTVSKSHIWSDPVFTNCEQYLWSANQFSMIRLNSVLAIFHFVFAVRPSVDPTWCKAAYHTAKFQLEEPWSKFA